MKNLILQQPKKEAVEGLISSVLFGYSELQRIINKPMEDYEIKKGLLRANLGIVLNLDMELEELITKSFSLKSKIGIIAPARKDITQTFEGAIPSDGQIEAYREHVLDGFGEVKEIILKRINVNKEEINQNIDIIKQSFKELKKNAKNVNDDAVRDNIETLSLLANWETKINLFLLKETAMGLIELAGQVGFYMGGTKNIIDELELSLDLIKTKHIWFTIGKAEFTRPWADRFIPSGTFVEKIDDKLIAKEFITKFKNKK